MAYAMQLSELNLLSLSNNKNCRLKKVEFFLYYKREVSIKLTIHQNSVVSKALLENFKITDHKY